MLEFLMNLISGPDIAYQMSINPLVLGGAAAVIGGLFGKKKSSSQRSAPQIDIRPLLEAIEKGRARQQKIVSGVRPQLQPLGTQFRQNIGGTLAEADVARRERAREFLQDIGTARAETGEELSDILSRRVLERQPELTRQLRESLAATGQLQTGAAGRAFKDLQTQLATQIARGESEIALAQQQARNRAIEQVFQLDENFIRQQLGVNRDTLVELFRTGRQDLINEAIQLLGVEQAAQAGVLGTQQFGATQNLAQQAATAARQQSFFDALTQLGTTAIGAGLTPRAPAGGAGLPIDALINKLITEQNVRPA